MTGQWRIGGSCTARNVGLTRCSRRVRRAQRLLREATDAVTQRVTQRPFARAGTQRATHPAHPRPGSGWKIKLLSWLLVCMCLTSAESECCSTRRRVCSTCLLFLSHLAERTVTLRGSTGRRRARQREGERETGRERKKERERERQTERGTHTHTHTHTHRNTQFWFSYLLCIVLGWSRNTHLHQLALTSVRTLTFLPQPKGLCTEVPSREIWKREEKFCPFILRFYPHTKWQNCPFENDEAPKVKQK